MATEIAFKIPEGMRDSEGMEVLSILQKIGTVHVDLVRNRLNMTITPDNIDKARDIAGEFNLEAIEEERV